MYHVTVMHANTAKSYRDLLATSVVAPFVVDACGVKLHLPAVSAVLLLLP